MGNVINLFMWGYQQHYQISAQNSAESIFNQLDRSLQPNLFLLGVLVDELENRHPICLEPDDCGFRVEAFSNVKSLARELESSDEEKNIIHSHPIAQENHDRKLEIKSLKNAIEKILNKESYLENKNIYCSWPTKVKGYMVFVVLTLDKKAYESHYQLTKTKFADRYHISTSLIDSSITEFLNECTDSLKGSNPGAGLNVIKKDYSELLRSAAKQFMYAVSSVGDIMGLHGLYDGCNTISSMKYEGAEGVGRVIIAKENHPNVDIKVRFKEPTSFHDYRKVRKILEMSDEKTSLISDGYGVYGLGTIIGEYNPREESLYVINFTKHFHWEVTHDNNVLMSIAYREPSLPKGKLNRAKFFSDIKRLFKQVDNDDIKNLWKIVLQATKQKHGTMLVITEGAEEEAKRLGGQGFQIKPYLIDEKTIAQISSIDGSIVIDPKGICHAFGVILDGLANNKGDSSRGARYNSAIRYYEYIGKTYSCLIVVISEDGMINFVPDLRPQVDYSDITNQIEKLEDLEKEEEFNVKEFNLLMSWFEKHEFYLTESECTKINELRVKLEGKLDKETIRIVRRDLTPNEDMNDSFYLKK